MQPVRIGNENSDSDSHTMVANLIANLMAMVALGGRLAPSIVAAPAPNCSPASPMTPTATLADPSDPLVLTPIGHSPSNSETSCVDTLDEKLRCHVFDSKSRA